MPDLSGQIALITGGGSGIGRATALMMAQAGAKVVVAARTEEELDSAVEEIRSAGGEADLAVADVTDEGSISDAVKSTIKRFGDLSIVVPNAGTNGTWAPIDKLTPDDWQSLHKVNLFGTFLTMRAAIPHLKKRGGGSIVAVGSINGTRIFSNAGSAAYATSKAGQSALVKVAALELAPHKIRVNIVCPGAILTSIQDKMDKHDAEQAAWPVALPHGRVPLNEGNAGSPEQAAAAITFLASDEASLISGTELYVDGAESLVGETSAEVEANG